VGFKYPLLWLLLLLNALIWLPLSLAEFPTIGLGHDSQLFAPGIHALLRGGNMPWDLMTRFAEARVDIFSYPYFSIIYPFYWTLGVNGEFSYDQHLVLDLSSVIFHMVTASLTFGLFLSRVGCRLSIAAFGGIAYAYSLHMKLWSAWIWALSAYAWIPLCLLGVWEIVVAGRHRLGILYLGLGFGLIALASGVGLVYAVVLSAVLMLALWARQAKTIRLILLDLRTVVAGGLLGAAIGAAHLIPVLYRMHDYIRWYSGGALIGQFKPPYEGTLAQTLDWPSGMWQLIAPLALEPGKSVGHLYVGAAILALALMLLIKASVWRRFALVLWAASLYFLLDTFGDATFVHQINYALPLLGAIRYPLASAVVPVVLLTLMACIAMEYLLGRFERDELRSGRWLNALYCAVIASVFGLVLVSVDLQSGISNFEISPVFYLPAVVAIFGLTLGCLGKKRAWLIVFPALLLFSYLPQYSLLMHPKVPDRSELYNQCDDFLELESSLREWSSRYPESARLSVHLPATEFEGCLKNKKVSAALLQSLAVMTGWNVMQPYISPRPYLEFKLFSRLSSARAIHSHSQMLKAGVSHILTTYSAGDLEALNRGFEERGRVGPFVLYELKNWQLGQDVAGCISGRDGQHEIKFLKGSRGIELSPALIKSGLAELRCGATRERPGVAPGGIARTFSSGGVRYDLEANRPLLFVSDRVMRDDWVVKVNGVLTEPVLVDQYRMAVKLERGLQVIEFSHRPLDFYIGLLISLIGALLTAILAFRERPQRVSNVGVGST